MENKKMTKRDNYAELLSLLATDAAKDFDVERLTTFIQNELELLDKRAANSKARNEKSKSEGDELRDAVQAALTADTFMTVSDIHAIVGNDEITPAKVVARLTQLTKAGIVVKENATVKTDDGKQRKLMCYKLA